MYMYVPQVTQTVFGMPLRKKIEGRLNKCFVYPSIPHLYSSNIVVQSNCQ